MPGSSLLEWYDMLIKNVVFPKFHRFKFELCQPTQLLEIAFSYSGDHLVQSYAVMRPFDWFIATFGSIEWLKIHLYLDFTFKISIPSHSVGCFAITVRIYELLSAFGYSINVMHFLCRFPSNWLRRKRLPFCIPNSEFFSPK